MSCVSFQKPTKNPNFPSPSFFLKKSCSFLPLVLLYFILFFLNPFKNQFSATLFFPNPFLDSSLLSISSLDHHLYSFSFLASLPPIPLLIIQSSSAPLLQPPPWQGGHILATRLLHAAHLWESSPTSKWNAQLSLGGKKISHEMQKGSTNMPLFGRVHEHKECEHWNEMRVWIMSIMNWTLPNKKKEPLRYISRTQTRSNQQRTKRALKF